MIFLLFTFAVAIICVLIFQSAARSVYGPLLSDDFLKKYVPKLLKKAWCHHGDILSNIEQPYITRHSGDLFAQWHISDVGRIPRKSKWHKIVNDRWLELLLK